nr:DUF3027 domain-containing protein [uncultured Microbacterium sp.]
MTSMPETPDERLIGAHDLALAALHEITPARTVGAPVGHTVEDDGVVSLRFQNLQPGYPSWFWTVSVAVVEGSEPTVLEVELLPGEGALLAPEWVPWAERLADYQAAQAAAAAEHGDAADDSDDAEDDDDLDELDDLDASDFDQDGSPILHAGDVDGVDIDSLDEDADDEDDDEDADSLDEDDDDDDDSLGADDADSLDEDDADGSDRTY